MDFVKDINAVIVEKVDTNNFSNEQYKRILSIYVKALELACKNKQSLVEFFIEQAYKELSKTKDVEV